MRARLSLLCGTVLFILACMWIGRYLGQDRATAPLEDRGAKIFYECRINVDGEICDSFCFRLVKSCRPLLDPDMFWRVRFVDFEGIRAEDADVIAVSRIPGLEGIGLTGQKGVTDEVLPFISEMRSLKVVKGSRSGFSKAGLESLCRKRPDLVVDQ